MKAQRISTIERQYSNQWVVVEVTRLSRTNQALSGRVLAHATDEDAITREAVRIRHECPHAHLWTFYTGPRIPHGMILALAGF